MNEDQMMTWAEKIMACLQPDGTEKKGLWFTHGAIVRRLRQQGYEGVPDNIVQFLAKLTRKGCLERSKRVAEGDLTRKPSFIYRLTGKPYRPVKMGITKDPKYTRKGSYAAFRIYNQYRDLPKWFRDMML